MFVIIIVIIIFVFVVVIVDDQGIKDVQYQDPEYSLVMVVETINNLNYQFVDNDEENMCWQPLLIT